MKTYKSGIALVRLHDHQAWVAGDNFRWLRFSSHTRYCGPKSAEPL